MSKFNLIDNVAQDIVDILKTDYDYYHNIFDDYDFNKSDYDKNRLLVNTLIPYVKDLLKQGIKHSTIGSANHSMIISLFDYLLDDSVNQSSLCRDLINIIKHDIALKKHFNSVSDYKLTSDYLT